MSAALLPAVEVSAEQLHLPGAGRSETVTAPQDLTGDSPHTGRDANGQLPATGITAAADTAAGWWDGTGTLADTAPTVAAQGRCAALGDTSLALLGSGSLSKACEGTDGALAGSPVGVGWITGFDADGPFVEVLLVGASTLNLQTYQALGELDVVFDGGAFAADFANCDHRTASGWSSCRTVVAGATLPPGGFVGVGTVGIEPPARARSQRDEPVTPAAQRAALIALYDATDGPNWRRRSNWNTAAPVSDWYGVTTDDNGSVTSLDLSSNALSGSIPTEIGNLTKLTSLDLGWNNVSGSIPTEIGNLTNLTYLHLGYSRLSGSIPTRIGNLTNLTHLLLYRNSLSGSIPTQIGNLTKLTFLDLGTNNLSGSIPTEIGNLTNLTRLDLDSNGLSGSIPTEVGNLTNLTVLYLGSNSLSGSIPTEVGNLTDLLHFGLGSNSLSGAIPAEVGNLTNLYSLRLNDNSLSGSIPAELGNLTNLHTVLLNGNTLSGCVPEGLARGAYPGIRNIEFDSGLSYCAAAFVSVSYDNSSGEGDGTVVFTVEYMPYEGADAGVTSPFSFDYATAARTATEGSDYTPVSGTLVIPEGVGRATITVPLVDDSAVEDSEWFWLNLFNPRGVLMSRAFQNATIIDDDGEAPATAAAAPVCDGAEVRGSVNDVFEVEQPGFDQWHHVFVDVEVSCAGEHPSTAGYPTAVEVIGGPSASLGPSRHCVVPTRYGEITESVAASDGCRTYVPYRTYYRERPSTHILWIPDSAVGHNHRIVVWVDADRDGVQDPGEPSDIVDSNFVGHRRVGVFAAEAVGGTPELVWPGQFASIRLRLVDGDGDPLAYTLVRAEISWGPSADETLWCSAPRAAAVGSSPPEGCVSDGEGRIVFSYKVAASVSSSRQERDSVRIYIDEDGDGGYDPPPIWGVPGEPVYYYGVRIAKPINYVALGDSYSAGENGRQDALSGQIYQSTRPADPECRRWVEAYPLVFAEDHLGDDRLHSVVTYACVGAITYNVYAPSFYSASSTVSETQTNRPSHVAEVDPLDADWEPRQGASLAAAGGVDMVTVTIGGNDAGFAEVLKACMTRRCGQATLDGQEALADIGARIEKMLEQIKLDAPGASVFVLGYPYLTPRYAPIACKSLRPDNLLAAVGVDPIAIELLYQVLYELEPAARRAIYDAIAALYLTGARLNNQVQTTVRALTTAATEFAQLVRDVDTATQRRIEEALATLVSATVAFSGAVRASVSESMAGVGEAALADSVAQRAAARALADAVGALGEWGADAGGAVLDFFVSPFRDALTGLAGQSLARSPDAGSGVGDAVDAWIDNFTLYGRVYRSGFELVDALRIDSVEALLLRRAADALNAEISDAAAAAGVHFVPVAEFFDGHAPCESEPWVNGIEGQSVVSIPSFEDADGYFGWLMDFVGLVDRPVSGRSFHPNLSGHRAYAGVLASYIRGRLLAPEVSVTVAGLPANPVPDLSRSSSDGRTRHGIRSAPSDRDPRSQATTPKDSTDTEAPPGGSTAQMSLAGGLLVHERTSGSGAGCRAGAVLSGARLEFTGGGFVAGSSVRLAAAGATVSGTALAATQLAAVTADADGAISFIWTVPDWSQSSDPAPRLYAPLAVGPAPGGGLLAAATAMPLVAYTAAAPCAAADAASTSLGSAVRVAVLANDTAPPASPLQAATVMVDPAAGGSFIVAASDGSVTFTPDAGFYGTVSTRYRVADSHGLVVGADLVVTVDAGCTITGTPGGVEITGTDGDDVICVPDPTDPAAFHVIDAKAGNDTILAGDGTDWIHTGTGDDTVYARGGDDTIHTEAGTDTIYGGRGFDAVYAVDLTGSIIDDPGGYELIIGTAGSLPAAPQTNDDRAHADASTTAMMFVLGNDSDPDEDLDPSTLRITRHPAMGTAQVVYIAGDAALRYTAPAVDAKQVIAYEVCDRLGTCSSAEVTVTVGIAGCTIVGTDAADTLNGTPGDDVICGGPGDDTIYGNGGDDIIIGGAGNDTIYGGDATRIGAQDGNDIILGAAGDDTIHGGAGDDTIHGGAGDDTIYGNRDPDVIVGCAGDDIIVGGGENDILWGGPGNDNLDGHTGNDTIQAGTGHDILRGGNGDDTLWGNDGDDTITAGAGDDTLWGGPGNDTLFGNTQDDTLWGGPGDDTLWGQGHNDQLHGGPGDDTLRSGAGDDIAHGDSGNDTLDGGNGTDYLNGGTGTDTCTRAHTTTGCEPQTANRGTP